MKVIIRNEKKRMEFKFGNNGNNERNANDPLSVFEVSGRGADRNSEYYCGNLSA